ncbi:hypothetical protein [Streptomyces genisteinicus]|uniref:Secreted protein n=1 Tax=Streptomyces genisteinicus TaxID=2768068 RepID=A0A7H0HS74_9ACTN|nr:hypothetical protein [Streptomyces genisteinicus]QNP63390.1 hypothetical protein IAG43_10890 [Streptomyces genisteinicus]
MDDGAGHRGGARPGRSLRRVVAVLTATAALALAAPVAQSAAAAAPCAGRLAKSVSFTTGELRVYRSGQQVCAVTLARNPGIRRAMSVSLQARGGRADVDEGRFSRQAGPVTVSPRGRCVRATGAVSGVSRSTGWILC